ncbi:MAG: membrane integrity-associated transporter subunit PqiC [Alphaproteobacteria bacterium]|nr:membrane integrity-associated transporter subunit PqiC [Alphaproteobacteria bacterium SS10]
MKSTKLNRRALLGGVGSALPLVAAGCSLPLPGGKQPDLYTLTPKSTYQPGLPQVDAQLLVEEPVAASGLNTARIVLRPDPYQIEYYASVSWADRAPNMVQTLMIESFETSQRIVSVGRETTGLRADFILKSELREFQAEYFDRALGSPPDVRVRISGTLIQMPQRVIVDRLASEEVVTAEGGGLKDIIRAFDQALGSVLGDMVAGTLEIMASV